MAFSSRSLIRLTNQAPVGAAAGTPKAELASGFFYITDDAAAVVEAANYFNADWRKLTKGSVILSSMVNGGTPVLKAYVVTASSSTAVTVALLTTTAG